MIEPRQITVTCPGILFDTFGKVEIELVCGVFIHWHHINSPKQWRAVSMGELSRFVRTDPQVRTWMYFRNSKASTPGLVWLGLLLDGFEPTLKAGILTGWVNGDRDSTATVTDLFFSKIKASQWCDTNDGGPFSAS